jgi:hypothetical protein
MENIRDLIPKYSLGSIVEKEHSKIRDEFKELTINIFTSKIEGSAIDIISDIEKYLINFGPKDFMRRETDPYLLNHYATAALMPEIISMLRFYQDLQKRFKNEDGIKFLGNICDYLERKDKREVLYEQISSDENSFKELVKRYDSLSSFHQSLIRNIEREKNQK